jgi:hypothetical protein
MHISEVEKRILNEMSERGLIERLCNQEHDKLITFYINMAYAIGYDEGRKQKTHQRKVAQYSMNGYFIKIFGSVTLAANSVGKDKSALSKAARGKLEHCGGYKWKYIEDGTS